MSVFQTQQTEERMYVTVTGFLTCFTQQVGESVTVIIFCWAKEIEKIFSVDGHLIDRA